MYRTNATRAVSGTIVYGPFPWRWIAVLFVFVGLGIGSLVAMVAIGSERVACDAAGRCVVERFRPPFATLETRFSRDDLDPVSPARVERVVGSKGHVGGKVVIEVRGAPITLGTTESYEASEVVARIALAARTHGAMDVTVRPSWGIGVVALLMLSLGTFAAVAFVRNAGTYRITVASETIEVQRRFFAIPLSTTRFSARDVVDVVAETEQKEDFFTPKSVKSDFGRLVLATRDGKLVPLVPRMHRGYTLHYRAAAALRSILELAPGAAEAALARLEPVSTPAGTRFAYMWAGACTGFLLGPLTTLVPLALAGHAHGEISMPAFLAGAAYGAAIGVGIAIYRSRPLHRD